MASNQTNRFQSLDSSVEEFIDGQENENTKKKTKHDVALFHEFLVLKGETRQMDELTPQKLNKFLSEFLIKVNEKEDNEEYESNSPRAFFASFERHLKKKNYELCLMKDFQFEQNRKVLQSKQRDLKRKGKGKKPNASAALSKEDVQVLYEKDLLEKFHGRSAFKHGVIQQHNPFLGTRLQGAQRNKLGRLKTLF